MQDDCIPVPLGIPGLRVIGCTERAIGLEVNVETEAKGGVCPSCGTAALVPKERPVVVVRDLPIRGVATWLLWRKRRYQCLPCGRTFTEAHAEIPARARSTRRYDRYLYERVAAGAPIARVAREEALSFYRVQRVFSDSATGALATRRPRPPRVLGIDEAAHRRGQVFNTVVTDPVAPGV